MPQSTTDARRIQSWSLKRRFLQHYDW
jgi:hypothetical protein